MMQFPSPGAAPMQIENLSVTLSVLSAMVTPAVLILASSSLILATSNRLSRAIDRFDLSAHGGSPSAARNATASSVASCDPNRSHWNAISRPARSAAS